MQALKGLALLRLGRPDDAATMVDGVIDAMPGDTATLQAVTMYCRELGDCEFLLKDGLPCHAVRYTIPLNRSQTRKWLIFMKLLPGTTPLMKRFSPNCSWPMSELVITRSSNR